MGTMQSRGAVATAGRGCRDSSLHREHVAACVRLEHATIRALLDRVERQLEDVRGESAHGLTRLRSALWDLYLTFDEHMRMEERCVAPILRLDDDKRAVAMILEHNEQRRVLVELVEDIESDRLDTAAVVARSDSLLDTLRTDMALEERSIGRVLASAR